MIGLAGWYWGKTAVFWGEETQDDGSYTRWLLNEGLDSLKVRAKYLKVVKVFPPFLSFPVIGSCLLSNRSLFN